MGFDFGGALGGLFGLIASGIEQKNENERADDVNHLNYQIATETNDLNRQIAQEANANNLLMTRETNQQNREIAEQNLGFQRENLDYQKALQKQIFEREDTAYQRTAQDMLAAGLNPLSMQGTNGAGEVISTSALNNNYQAQQAPSQITAEMKAAQMEKANGGYLSAAVSQFNDFLSTANQIQTGQLERDKLQQEVERQKLENDALRINNDKDYLQAQKDYNMASWKHWQREWEHFEKSGKYESDSKYEEMITAVEDWLLGDRGEQMWNKLTEKYPALKMMSPAAKPLIKEATTRNVPDKETSDSDLWEQAKKKFPDSYEQQLNWVENMKAQMKRK